ncbi:uncharacterized protein CCOS01_16429 [Colletotrichum costaricense]|uniref:Uncharacterized protein n=1 Tax=Colletotrichum costaricense TaxID=1209916 RepID=A0AAJ0DSB7_9PEZI|nr:uncharacterized protein CCOS01_16429 [Colletotrichum costaricense]KAK1506570.1 hypothetical protein CCOS01_16429 [Colletotrichum costaricense]
MVSIAASWQGGKGAREQQKKLGTSTSGSRPDHYCPGAGMMGETLRDTAAFEYCALPAECCQPIPNAVLFAHAACLPTAYGTTLLMTMTHVRISTGEKALIGILTAGKRMRKNINITHHDACARVHGGPLLWRWVMVSRAASLRPRHFGDAREHILENVDPTIRACARPSAPSPGFITTCACHPVDEVARLDKKYKHDIDAVVGPGMVAGLVDSLKTTLGMADNIAVVEFIDCVKGKHEPRRIIVPASRTGIQPQQLPNADRPVKPHHASVAPSFTNPSTLIPPMTPTLRLTAAVGYPVPAVYPAVSGFIVRIGPIWMSISEFRFSATSVRGVFAKPSADDQDRRVVHRQEREIVAHARRPDNADPDPDNMRAHAAPGRLLRPAQFRPVRLRSRLHSLTHRCGWTVRKTVAMPGIILALTTATFVIISLLYYDIPKGFCSTEDNCLITSMAIGPDDASFNAILALPIAL